MKAKFLLAALLAGASIASVAQGYKDGIDFYKIGEYENAKTILDNNMATASNKAEVYYYYGQIALSQKDKNVAEAKANFDKGVAANPKYPYNYVGQGAVALLNGNKGAAEDLFKAARKNSKKDAALEIAIGRAYFNANPTTYAKEIRKCIAKARKMDKTSPEPDILEGDMAMAQQDYGKAMGSYEMAMNFDPTNIESTVKYSDSYYRVNPELALEKLNEIIRLQPKSALVQRQLAMKLYDHGDFTEAATTYGNFVKNSINHFPQDEARFSQLLFTKRQYKQACDVASNLEKSLQPGEDYYIAALRLQLYSLAEQHRWAPAAEKGAQLFNAALGKEKDNLYLRDYIYYAKVLEANNEPEKAIEYYKKAIEMNPGELSLSRSLVDQYLKAKKYDSAIEFANTVIANEKSEPSDLHKLAQIYTAMVSDTALTNAARVDAIQKAIEQENKAISAEPDNINYLSNLAYLQQMYKKDAEAVQTLTKLIDVIKTKSAGNISANNKQFLAYAYNVIFTYYYKAKNVAKCKEIAAEWHELMPDDATATKYYDALNK